MNPLCKNEYNITWDKAGFCAYCHVPVAEFEGSDGEGNFVIKRLKPNIRSVNFLLNDGSSIRVALCENCEQGIIPEWCADITDSVVRGWEESKKQQMHELRKKHIINRCDNPWGEELLSRISIPESKGKEKVT